MDLIIATIINLCFLVAINVVSVLLLIMSSIIIFLTVAENCSIRFKIFILISL